MSLLATALLLADFLHTSVLPANAQNFPGNASSVELAWTTDTVTSPVQILETATSIVTTSPEALETSFLLSLSPATTLLPAAPVVPQIVTITEVLTDVVITTATDSPTTVTVSASSSTVTETTTSSPTQSSSASAQQAWSAPATMTNLNCFNVTHFADGKQNMQIVNSIPNNATGNTTGYSDVLDLANNGTLTTATPSWSDGSSVMQLLYPAGSIDPANEPQGGADFYALPLDLTDAQNVTLSYSVFFPADFDWVQGGKLPGLYGGHTQCSGGDDALSCFSTRLMWRPGGAGELYLYAPKDKQTEALCSTPPFSLCDSDYGLSIARGSFQFAAGAWTTVQQTVALNTPGQQDGAFTLLVNGEPVIDRSDVFYRDVPTARSTANDPESGSSQGGVASGSSDDPAGPGDGGPASMNASGAKEPSDQDGNVSASPGAGADPDDVDGDGGGDGSGGLLGLGIGPLGLLGDVLAKVNVWPGGIYLEMDGVGAAVMDPVVSSLPDPTAGTPTASAMEDEDPQEAVTDTATMIDTSSPMSTSTQIMTTITTSVTVTTVSDSVSTTTVQPSPSAATTESTESPGTVEQVTASKPIGFSGLFFSTFFGGHEQEWATPRDQYTWFTGFSITVNN